MHAYIHMCMSVAQSCTKTCSTSHAYPHAHPSQQHTPCIAQAGRSSTNCNRAVAPSELTQTKPTGAQDGLHIGLAGVGVAAKLSLRVWECGWECGCVCAALLAGKEGRVLGGLGISPALLLPQ